MKATKKGKKENKTDPKTYSSILRIVSPNNAFYFFIDAGKYTDKCSTCLADFCNTIQTIDIRSVEFHFKRGDFAKWIKGTLGDSELALEIEQVSKTIQGEELRKTLHQTVEARVNKLKKYEASEEPYLERSG